MIAGKWIFPLMRNDKRKREVRNMRMRVRVRVSQGGSGMEEGKEECYRGDVSHRRIAQHSITEHSTE